MILSKKAINSLSIRIRNRLALEMDCSAQTIERWIKSNTENGSLTTVKAIEIISTETGLSQEEILENVVAAA